MFWDKVAGGYDVFVNVINRKTRQKRKEIVSDLIEPDDTVGVKVSLADGRIPCAVAVTRKAEKKVSIRRTENGIV